MLRKLSYQRNKIAFERRVTAVREDNSSGFFESQSATGTAAPVRPGIAGDVSYKLAEEELHNLQCALVENLEEGVMLIDKTGSVIYANSAVRRLLEIELAHAVGKNVRKVLHTQPANKFVALLRHGRKSAAQDEFSLVVRQREFKPVIISIMKLHLYGKLVLAIVISENKVQLRYKKLLREKKRILARQKRELQKADDDLNAFTFVSSHHLQEPLRKIRSFVSVILEKEEEHLSLLGQNYFARLQRAAVRMQLLIADLLAYCGTRKKDFEFEDADLNVLLSDVLEDFGRLLDERKVMSEIGHLPKMRVIPFQIRQLFHHLLSNSLKFASKNEPLEIKVSSRMIRGVSVKGLEKRRKYARITFSDNGIGFDPAYADRIFEMFQRLHAGEEYQGTGIGLAICRRVVENHSGLLMASGEKGKGACFNIYLPL